jgi:hypothetical protein
MCSLNNQSTNIQHTGYSCLMKSHSILDAQDAQCCDHKQWSIKILWKCQMCSSFLDLSSENIFVLEFF